MVTGPWKGGRAAGRARRGESVIVGSKKRVHVNLSDDPMFAKVFMGTFSDEECQNFAPKSALSGWAKTTVFRDILVIFSKFSKSTLI